MPEVGESLPGLRSSDSASRESTSTSCGGTMTERDSLAFGRPAGGSWDEDRSSAAARSRSSLTEPSAPAANNSSGILAHAMSGLCEADEPDITSPPPLLPPSWCLTTPPLPRSPSPPLIPPPPPPPPPLPPPMPPPPPTQLPFEPPPLLLRPCVEIAVGESTESSNCSLCD